MVVKPSLPKQFMPIKFCATLLLFLVSLGLAAQAGKLSKANRQALAVAEDRMAGLVATMYTDSSEEARFTACRDLIKQLVAALDRPNSFNYEFTKLKGLSVQYPEDRSFRIFTWELHIDRDNYRHYGAIQRNSKKLDLTPLVDRGDQLLQNPETARLSSDNWLGYAVYRMKEGGTYRGRPYYFLFGYDTYEAFRRRKILDVLSFNENGQPVFGLPIFISYNDAGLLIPDRTRIVLQYGAGGVITLRYDEELDSIIYENLIMVEGPHEEGPIQMPDGSYHALQREADGRWREQDRIFTHIYEEAPREAAKPDDGGRDLIGRPRGGG